LPPRVERAVLGEKAVRTGAIAVARTEVRRAIIRRLVESQGAVEA
jgi:hypothetical protein